MIKRFRALPGLALLAAMFFANTAFTSVQSGQVTFKYYPQSTEAVEDMQVEIVGDMTDWGNETMQYSPDGYFFKKFNLTAGSYEFYFIVDGEAVNDMRDSSSQTEPSPDSFVNDGYGGQNAVLKVLGSGQTATTSQNNNSNGEGPGPLVFRYYPNPLMDESCGSGDPSDPRNRSVTITGDMNDWGDDSLEWNEAKRRYEIVYDELESGDYEFYFSLCDDAINNMDEHKAYFEPRGVTFVDDGYGGSNAVVSYNSQQGPLVLCYYPNDLMDSDCEAAMSDSDEPKVTITGDMNDWDSDELEWNDSLECYEISYYGLREGDYEFYFSLCGDAINDMKEHAQYFEPNDVSYVDDGYDGFNAVVYYAGDPNASDGLGDGDYKVEFKFFPNDRATEICGGEGDLQVEITGDMNDWDSTKMAWDAEEECYKITYYLDKGDYEFYFLICDDAIDNMKYFSRWFEPSADYYTDDGYGGFNAVITVMDDGHFYTRAPRSGTSSGGDYDVVFRYYPSAEDEDASGVEAGDMSIEITGDMNDWTSEAMDWNGNLECFEKTFSLSEGDYEFYFIVNGDAIDNMKWQARNFEPPADEYVDDGYGGFNAVIQVGEVLEEYYQYER